MKKLVSTLLAATMALPCVFGLTACNGGGGGGTQLSEYDILKDEWENVISTEREFEIRCESEREAEDGTLLMLNYDIYEEAGDEITNVNFVVKQNGQTSGLPSRRFEKRPVHQPSGITYKYCELLGDDVEEELTETEFYAPFAKYIELINYVDDNYDKFRDEGSDYMCDATVACAENTAIADLGITYLGVGRNFPLSGRIYVRFAVIGTIWNITFENPLKEAYENTAKFAIKGGPSTEDIDYAEYYFDGDNGFRLYSPNNPIANRTDGYYKSNGDGTYTQYVKQDDGSWATGNVPASNIQTAMQATKNQYLGFMKQMDKLMVIEERESDMAAYVYGLNPKFEELTQEIGGLTYHYYDIKMQVFFDDQSAPRIYSITWKMKMSNAMAESLEYNMAFSSEGVNIVYPTVG